MSFTFHFFSSLLYFLFLNNKKSYFSFRDDGIVIAITFWQWFVELVFNLLLIGLVAGLGANRRVDHFAALTSLWVGTSLVPSFYFMACAEFRRDLETFGLLKAFWRAITKDSYDN